MQYSNNQKQKITPPGGKISKNLLKIEVSLPTALGISIGRQLHLYRNNVFIKDITYNSVGFPSELFFETYLYNCPAGVSNYDARVVAGSTFTKSADYPVTLAPVDQRWANTVSVDGNYTSTGGTLPVASANGIDNFWGGLTLDTEPGDVVSWEGSSWNWGADGSRNPLIFMYPPSNGNRWRFRVETQLGTTGFSWWAPGAVPVNESVYGSGVLTLNLSINGSSRGQSTLRLILSDNAYSMGNEGATWSVFS